MLRFLIFRVMVKYQLKIFQELSSPVQDWKANNHCMGEVRAYQPNPPEVDNEIDPSTYGFKFVEVEVNNRKSGWDRFTFSLPQKVRSLHANDVVYGAEWRKLVMDFEERYPVCGFSCPIIFFQVLSLNLQLHTHRKRSCYYYYYC